jgi:hypothetical protein
MAVAWMRTPGLRLTEARRRAVRLLARVTSGNILQNHTTSNCTSCETISITDAIVGKGGRPDCLTALRISESTHQESHTDLALESRDR